LLLYQHAHSNYETTISKTTRARENANNPPLFFSI